MNDNWYPEYSFQGLFLSTSIILHEIYCCCTLFSKKKSFLTWPWKKHLYKYLGNMHSMTPRSYRESKSIWPLVCTKYIDRSIIDLIFPNHFFLNNLQETLNWLLIDWLIYSVQTRGQMYLDSRYDLGVIKCIFPRYVYIYQYGFPWIRVFRKHLSTVAMFIVNPISISHLHNKGQWPRGTSRFCWKILCFFWRRVYTSIIQVIWNGTQRKTIICNWKSWSQASIIFTYFYSV